MEPAVPGRDVGVIAHDLNRPRGRVQLQSPETHRIGRLAYIENGQSSVVQRHVGQIICDGDLDRGAPRIPGPGALEGELDLVHLPEGRHTRKRHNEQHHDQPDEKRFGFHIPVVMYRERFPGKFRIFLHDFGKGEQAQ